MVDKNKEMTVSNTDLTRNDGWAPIYISTPQDALNIGKVATQIAMGTPEALAAKVLVGHELGLTPMSAIRLIHVLEQRDRDDSRRITQRTVQISALAMRALVRASGKCAALGVRGVALQSGKLAAEAYGKRSDTGEEQTYRFSETDAETAGLAQRQTWKRYKKRMLAHRAMTYLVQELWPEVISGLAVSGIGGDVINPETEVMVEQAAEAEAQGETVTWPAANDAGPEKEEPKPAKKKPGRKKKAAPAAPEAEAEAPTEPAPLSPEPQAPEASDEPAYGEEDEDYYKED